MSEKKEELVILPEDPRAAELVTVQAWKSRDGSYWVGDERMARWCGSTHVHCSRCGGAAEKPYTACEACRHLKDIEKYDAMPKKKWDGKGMIYSDAYSEYWTSLEDAREFLDCSNDELDQHLTLADLRLVICEPTTARYLETDYWCDDLPEDSDGELPGWLADAIDVFNKTLKEHDDDPLSYSPGKFAVDLSEEVLG